MRLLWRQNLRFFVRTFPGYLQNANGATSTVKRRWEVHLDRAPRDEIREISIEQTSRSRHPCSREIRDGVRTCTYVRTLMYAVVSRYIHRYTYRTYVVTSYWPDLDPRSRVKSLISTHDLEWNLGCLGCEMISSHLDLEGWFSISSRSRRGARDEIEMHL